MSVKLSFLNHKTEGVGDFDDKSATLEKLEDGEDALEREQKLTFYHQIIFY